MQSGKKPVYEINLDESTIDKVELISSMEWRVPGQDLKIDLPFRTCDGISLHRPESLWALSAK